MNMTKEDADKHMEYLVNRCSIDCTAATCACSWLHNRVEDYFLAKPASAVPESGAQWVPVGERMPEPNKRVLLWDADNAGSGTEAFGYYTGNKKVQWMGENYDYDNCPGQAYGVTHWMELPAGPDSPTKP